MKKRKSGTPETPRSGKRAPAEALDVRSLRELVASSAAAQPPIAVDRPYAETLRNSVDWLWQTDAELNLTYLSRALDDTEDGPGESWLGRSLLALADREAGDATPSPLVVALRARRAFRDCTVEWTSDSDQRVRFRLTGLPFHDEATGAFAGFRGTASATSEPAEESGPARELMDLLEAALSERDQLQQQLAEIEDGSVKERLAGIAHELRTPLNAIIGFSELIRDQAFGDDPRRYAEYGGNIHRSGLKLLQLVNRILDIAEHESETHAIEPRPFDIEAVVRATIEIMSDSAATAHVALYLDVADALPRAHGDRQMTRQILFHLVSRVLQRAPAGWAAGIRLAADEIPGEVPDEIPGETTGEKPDEPAGPATGVLVTVWDGPGDGPGDAPGDALEGTAGGAREADRPKRQPERQSEGQSGVESETDDKAQAGPRTAETDGNLGPEDLGPVVLQHLAETMGARLSFAGEPGRGSEARLYLPPPPPDLPEPAEPPDLGQS